MEVHFEFEDLNQVEDKVVAHVGHEQRDLPAVVQCQWCQVEVHFDFEDLYPVKDKIMAHLRHKLGNLPAEVQLHECHVSKFSGEDSAWMVRDILLTVLGHFGPYMLPPFQVEADSSWYIAFVTEGALFKPSREKLYKSSALYDDRRIFFPSKSYKSILRDIITSVWLLSDTQLRCRLSLENIYIVEYEGVVCRATYAKFLRFDLQDRPIDDKVEVREELRKLFEEINSKCNVDSGSKAEFDLFLRNFTLDHPVDMYNNIIFWKKYQRMNFIDRVLELSRSESIVIYGDETKDAFEEDWESKLKSDPDILLFLHLNRHFTKSSSFAFDDTKGVPDTSMKKCIETIRDLYFNFERLKQLSEKLGAKPKFKDTEQVVDYIHYIFPYLIGALAERAFAMKWPLNMSFHPRLSRSLFFFLDDDLEAGK